MESIARGIADISANVLNIEHSVVGSCRFYCRIHYTVIQKPVFHYYVIGGCAVANDLCPTGIIGAKGDYQRFNPIGN